MAKKKEKPKKQAAPKPFDPVAVCKFIAASGVEKFILIGMTKSEGQIVLSDGLSRIEMVGQLEISKSVIVGEGLSNCRVSESEG